MLSYTYARDCASQNSFVSHAKLALAWVYTHSVNFDPLQEIMPKVGGGPVLFLRQH